MLSPLFQKLLFDKTCVRGRRQSLRGEGRNYFYLIVQIIDAQPVMLIPVRR
uniref:Uncharacterized protein n=1 Tax=Klebsiella pneumoniae subsp. pneumoniae TaxID=72407 RepID=A0A8F7KPE8_KLEPN|nr:hypothetical protein [Klebsiella pneumoniae subsp. pneumoniae]QXV91248.1 hypothetical protein [Klebsiella pneumoniae subsp. pneumoniae]QXV91550.1 hypothetical protein [Klebsiella pneumoniae subsp. pneumoniae]